MDRADSLQQRALRGRSDPIPRDGRRGRRVRHRRRHAAWGWRRSVRDDRCVRRRCRLCIRDGCLRRRSHERSDRTRAPPVGRRRRRRWPRERWLGRREGESRQLQSRAGESAARLVRARHRHRLRLVLVWIRHGPRLPVAHASLPDALAPHRSIGNGPRSVPPDRDVATSADARRGPACRTSNDRNRPAAGPSARAPRTAIAATCGGHARPRTAPHHPPDRHHPSWTFERKPAP